MSQLKQEGYDVPQEAIDAAAKRIEHAVGGGVDPEHIAVEVLRAALPFFFPKKRALSPDVPETKGDT